MIDVIIKDIDDTFFSILVDESQDISVKEQTSVVLRYVDKTGHVVERFIRIEHVSSTTAVSLKAAIDKLFSRYGLSISRLRGQGYDGASNMQAFIVIAKKHKKIQKPFNLVSSMVNIVGVSSKRCDILREKQEAIISEALINGEISSGRSLNQQSTIARFGDTHWGSHYRTLHNIDVPDMDSVFVHPGRSRHNTEEMTNFHRFRVDLFYSVIDMQLQELNAHFSEEFRELKGFSELALKLVETKRNKVYPLVYMLVILGLTLRVATALVERVFSAMNIEKNRLRNQIGDQWMNDSLVVYVEKDVFNEIDNKTIIRRFQSMRSRKEQL
ncbi:uncharacterized protein LOC111369063 [Olea europaea var. sylvestris]|uniref:uncharacterized protein LOC111369063 n=1 Tax=Olea europaea var. sylvestris TaxID=158386 RepID=UPI000C1D581E|nr:uncharacterized protein LOC111369063 [Olea europaea var. sylvestris]